MRVSDLASFDDMDRLDAGQQAVPLRPSAKRPTDIFGFGIDAGPQSVPLRPPAIRRPVDIFGLQALGQVEYWVIHPEDPAEPLLKTQCPPFMVAPGLEVAQIGPKGQLVRQPRAAGRRGRGVFSGMGSLGFWEALAPTGMRVAAMRCRPFYTQRHLTVKQVTTGPGGGAIEILRQSGAAPYPPGTIRERRGPLMTTRRG
jgi:hypothetical protein